MPAGDPDWEEGFATGTLPWNLPAQLGGPRRGALADYGGATCEDEDPKPDKITMLYADLVNGLQRHAEAVDNAIAAVIFTVTLDGGGAFVLSQVAGPGDAARDVANFTLTPNATGDVSITWPAGTFPASIAGPMAGLNDATVGGGVNARLISNGVSVLTWTDANTAGNRAFTVVVR